MAAQPEFHVKLTPEVIRPGDDFTVEVTLRGRGSTTVNGGRLRLRSFERRSQGDHEWTHTWFFREHELSPFQLQALEEKSFAYSFQLPATVLPSFRGKRAAFATVLELLLDIAWFPDEVQIREVPVRGAPRPPSASPRTSRSTPEGKGPNPLSLEVVLDTPEVRPGDVVRGSIVVHNSGYHELSGVQVSLLLWDEGQSKLARDVCLIDTLGPSIIRAGRPGYEERLPFEIALPAHACPTIGGVHSTIHWTLEARALVPRGRDLTLAVPITVLSGADSGPPAALTGGSVGASEQRTRLWAEVAKQCDLTFDASAGTLSAQLGSAALSISLELKRGKPWLVAAVRWPSVRLELEVVERTWRDFFHRSALDPDEAFAARFRARARDPRQLQAFVSPALRAALGAFVRVALDDDDARFASPGDGKKPAELARFALAATAAARLIAESAGRVPTPDGLEPCRAPWTALAAELGGQFFPGDCSIRGAQYRGLPVELATRFDGARPSATVARTLLSAPPPEPLPGEAQRIFSALAAEVPGARIEAGAVEATLPSPLLEPQRALSTWRSLQRLAQALGATPPSASS